MNPAALQKKIDTSKLLTQAERAYWTSHLAKMNEQQLQRLEHILDQAGDLPWQRNMETYTNLFDKALQFAQASR